MRPIRPWSNCRVVDMICDINGILKALEVMGESKR